MSLEVDAFGRLRLNLELELPPTDNNIYANMFRGRILTASAKRYISQIKENTAKSAITSTLQFRNDIPYRIEIVLYMKLYTKGWPNKAKWRFQKVDTTNRSKLLIDAICKAIGVDDRHITEVYLRKEDDPENQRVEVTLEELWKRS